MRTSVCLTGSEEKAAANTGVRASRAPVTERDFERGVLETLRLFGWRFTHFRPAKTEKGWRTPLSGDAGFPDIVAVRSNRVIWIELKAEKGRLSDEQGHWLAPLWYVAAA